MGVVVGVFFNETVQLIINPSPSLPGIPSCLHAVMGVKSLPAKKQTEAKKILQRLVEKRFPGGNGRVFSLDSPQDSLLLLRQANEQKRKIPALRIHRSYLVAENVAFQDGSEG